jgi:putative ABC transport system permease protein
MALSLVLLAGATLLLKSLWRLLSVDLGINPENVLTMQIMLPNAKYQERSRQREFTEEVLDRIGALPGVVAVAVCNMGVIGGDMTNSFDIQEHPAADAKNPPEASMRMVSPDYFRVLGIHLLRGRVFGSDDSATALPVAVINEAMARRFWPHGDPLGQHLVVEWGASKAGREIVGIVSNARDVQPQMEPHPEMYMPYMQLPQGVMQVMVRTRVDPRKMIAAVKGQILAVDKEQPVSSVSTLTQTLSESTSQPRFRTELLAAFALLAVVLAAVGIYGVMAYSVTQRTHELGIRMALGAERRDVLAMVVRHGMMLTLIGVAIGLGGALALTRLLSDMLYDVQPTDPSSFVAVSLLLTGVGLLASYIPARRATRVDPMVALRYE